MKFLRLERMTGWIQSKPALLAGSLGCAVAALWGLIEVLGGLTPARYSPYQTVWIRYGTHLLFLILVFGPRHKTGLVRTPRWKEQIFRGLLMLGMPAAFLFAAGKLDYGTLWSIFWTAPLIATGAAMVIFKERGSLAVWVATLLGMAGALLILRPSFAIGWKALLLTLGMALCFILYMLTTRQMRTENTLVSLFYTAVSVFVPLSFIMPGMWTPLTWKPALVMAFVGLAGLALLFALDRALEIAPVYLVAPFLYGEPVWFVLLSGALRHTPVDLSDLAGALIILVSNLFLLYRLSNRSSSRVTAISGEAQT